MDLFAKKGKIHNKGTEEITDYEIKQLGKSKLLFDFKKDCTFKHGEKLTNLIKARILEDYEKKATIAPDTAKHICFEIPTNISIEELVDAKIFEILNQLGKFENLMPDSYNNVGYIDKTENNDYELFKPTSEVLSYTRDVLDKEIGKREKLFTQRLQEEFKQRITIPATEYIKENDEKSKERKDNPFLEEQLRYKMGDRVYANYKGIDTKDGKILNINRLGQIKAVEEEILYSAFLEKRDNDDRIELKTLQQKPNGFPVLFTSETKIEEIVENGDKEQITKVLDLLSNIPNEELNMNELEFIGSIDKQGRIDRTKENCSDEIQIKIQEEKENFMNKQKKEKQEENERV